jgi:hypothetical protein
MTKVFLFSLVCFSFLVGCSANFLKELADKNSDDALIYDAQKAVNEQNYDVAIDLLTVKLSVVGQAKINARETLASAYAGKCGLNFISFVDGLANANSGSAFVLFSSAFVGVAVQPSFCLQSLQTLELIGPTESRSTDQNAFASVVGMVLVGTSTRLYTDNNPSNGDGVQDAVGISCTLATAQIDNIILGYGHMAKNFIALSTAQIGSSSSATISNSINACTAIAGSSCEVTDPAAITNSLRDFMKDLLNTTEFGVGTANGSNPLLIPAACP